jgi:hypothetical protein
MGILSSPVDTLAEVICADAVAFTIPRCRRAAR